MPRTIDGNYSLPAGTIVTSGETIRIAQHNPAMQDIAAALTASLSRTGQGAMQAPLNMGGYRVTGAANGTANTDVVTVGQIAGFGPLQSVQPGVTTDQAPAINTALASSTVSTVTLPAGVIWIERAVVVPANKTLVMQQGTILRALPTFTTVGGNNSGIVLAGDRATVSGGAVDMNGVGSSPSNRINGVTVNNACRDCRRLDIEVSNCTGYAVWDAGANALTAPPSSYNENVRTFNSQVHFEPQASDGTVYFNCHARDGTGSIPCFSYFHPLAGSRNIKYIACTAYGAASAGVDLNSNIDKLREIHLIDCDVETTGQVTALSHPAGFLGIESLRVIGGRYKSGAIGVSLVDTTATMVGVKMEGANGLESTNSNIDCTGCEAVGSRDPGGGASAFGAVAFGTGQVRFNAGALTATGPVGSAPSAGNVRVSADTNLIPAPAAPPILTKRVEYQAQLTPVSDGASCYANFQVPLNPADLAKVTIKIGVRNINTVAYTTSAYGPSWQYLTGNQFRARISGNNLNPANHIIDVHYIEFA